MMKDDLLKLYEVLDIDISQELKKLGIGKGIPYKKVLETMGKPTDQFGDVYLAYESLEFYFVDKKLHLVCASEGKIKLGEPNAVQRD